MSKIPEIAGDQTEQQPILTTTATHQEVKNRFADSSDLSVACSDFLASQVGDTNEMVQLPTPAGKESDYSYQKIGFVFTNEEGRTIEINLGILRIGYTMLLVSADMVEGDSFHLLEREILAAFLIKNPTAKISKALFDQVKPSSMKKLNAN
ncbi:MAG: hypothetical protein GW946_02455 [Candidatus Pacebacteria bacterium]|nr:hypothetical protein [Candidatus Paceibacterota bacterium]PIR60035.1 MAG: hypothetical protein COU67_03800 [Candidatus Pacebacteria bacterium CG10_big_fil_rev_8_21_14_0_10_44_54]